MGSFEPCRAMTAHHTRLACTAISFHGVKFCLCEDRPGLTLRSDVNTTSSSVCLVGNLSAGLAVASHLQVHDGEAVLIQPADDGVEVLKLGGQERPESPLQAHRASLLEAHEVCPADPSCVTRVRGVQGDEVQLRQTKVYVNTVLSQITHHCLNQPSPCIHQFPPLYILICNCF